MAPPVISSGPAFSPSVPCTSPTASRATENALARLRTATRIRLSIRIARDSRLRRRGLAVTKATSSSPSNAGSSQTGCTRVSFPGSGNCSAIATTTATVACQRASPSVGRFHAGIGAGLPAPGPPRSGRTTLRSSSSSRTCSARMPSRIIVLSAGNSRWPSCDPARSSSWLISGIASVWPAELGACWDGLRPAAASGPRLSAGAVCRRPDERS